MLKALPNREYLLAPDSPEERSELLGIADVLFAFCFEFRCSCGDFGVEAPHNITRLSALLSWLDAYDFPGDDAATVIANAARRSLAYPYVRHWRLVRKVLADVAKVLYLGKRCVLRCLLQCRGLMEHTDSHYMLNKIFLDDYCVWLQGLRPEALRWLADEFNAAKGRLEGSELAGRAGLGLGLAELESWAAEHVKRWEEGGNNDEDDDDDDDDDSEDEDEGGGGVGGGLPPVPQELYPPGRFLPPLPPPTQGGGSIAGAEPLAAEKPTPALLRSIVVPPPPALSPSLLAVAAPEEAAPSPSPRSRPLIEVISSNTEEEA